MYFVHFVMVGKSVNKEANGEFSEGIKVHHSETSPLSREDSRVHACIVCASISCPNVRMEAFQPDRVGEQMDSQVKDFLGNSKKGMCACEGGRKGGRDGGGRKGGRERRREREGGREGKIDGKH